MKVKIFANNDENKLEEQINKFTKAQAVRRIHYRASKAGVVTNYSVLLEYDDGSNYHATDWIPQ